MYTINYFTGSYWSFKNVSTFPDVLTFLYNTNMDCWVFEDGEVLFNPKLCRDVRKHVTFRLRR